jgi:hypothetical protein
MKKLSMMAMMGCLLFTACKKSDDDSESTTTGSRSASFKIGAQSYQVNKPYIGIFNNSGTINNDMSLEATDSSEVEMNFTGDSPSTYPLQSFSDAVYYTPSGKQYNSISGTLVTTSYTVDGATYKASGTFHFTAVAISAPNDTIEITDGVFTNASNEF